MSLFESHSIPLKEVVDDGHPDKGKTTQGPGSAPGPAQRGPAHSSLGPELGEGVGSLQGHLQLPNAPAVGGDAADSVVHEGDEHVEQQDVGEQHVGQQQQQHSPAEAQLLLEGQLAHADGELEELQGSVRDATVWDLATLPVLLSCPRPRCVRGIRTCRDPGVPDLLAQAHQGCRRVEWGRQPGETSWQTWGFTGQQGMGRGQKGTFTYSKAEKED